MDSPHAAREAAARVKAKNIPAHLEEQAVRCSSGGSPARRTPPGSPSARCPRRIPARIGIV